MGDIKGKLRRIEAPKMWNQRTLQLIVEGTPTTQEVLHWIRRSLPLFTERVEEAFVTGSKLPNGSLLLEISLGEARFADLKGGSQPLDFDSPPKWTASANPFAIGLGMLASLAGMRATVIDSGVGATAWTILVLGAEPTGAQRIAGKGLLLEKGVWVEDENADSLAGELVGTALGRRLWTFADYLQWWQSTYGGDLEVVLPPTAVVYRGRRVKEPGQPPKPSLGIRIWQWLKRVGAPHASTSRQ